MQGILQRVANRRHHRLNRRVRAADDLEEQGHFREAREVYHRVLAKEPANPSALRRLAGLSQLDGATEAAEDLWRRLHAVRPERPDAALQLARLRLRAGDLPEARSLAVRATELAPAGRPHELGHRARNLRDHLAAGEKPLANRHIAIGGMSFCGSTLLGFLLGSLPEVTNVGESHSLVFRRVGDPHTPVDFSRDAPEAMVPCGVCAGDCVLWTLPFRRQLATDPLDWYGKLASQAATPILVSSDKSHAKLSGLDPFGRHDLIVLFKSPVAAWASARRRPRPPKETWRYATRWEREYKRLLHDLPIQGRRIVMHFDAFRRRPDTHLHRLIELLEIPAPEGRDLLAVDPSQHVMGGNGFTHKRVASEGEGMTIRKSDGHDLPAKEADAIADRQERSAVFQELLAQHDAVFGSC